ncbi:replication initiation protein [Aeromonas salmonicida]|uniref:replication initiation protein n=1 Tax=Aeromonas salmonicida TaxID=645 RepID=UPI00309ECA59
MADLGKKKVRHRNELNYTLMSMSTTAKRVTYLAMIQIPFDESSGRLIFEEDKIYKIRAIDYAEICGVSISQAYKQLKDGISELKSKSVEIPKDYLGDDLDLRDFPSDMVVMFSLADYCAYSDGDGFVILKFHRKMRNLIANIERRFTTQYLLSAVRLPIGNANKLYLFLREKIGEGKISWVDVSFEELKYCLMVDDIESYKAFKVFNDAFFKPSSKQIIDKTEFERISIEIIERVKRRASKVRISYEYLDQDRHKLDAGMKKKIPSARAHVDVRPSKRALEMMEEVESLKNVD